jgi:GntR family transcriptional repressor for pyruvate dehydrogenase complex
MHAPARATVFEPVAPPSTYEETVARLGTAIRIGVLEPGTRLPPERDLAEQLGISRSTLRQALATLTETGHLSAVRGRSGGTFVSSAPPIASGIPVPLDEWRDLLDWRTALELGTVQLAAVRASDAELARLEEYLDVIEVATGEGWPAYRRADVQFHLAIAEAAGSPRLVAAMTEVQGEVTDLLEHVTHPSRALHHANEQHGRIYEALRKRDAARAATCMREHIEGTKTMVEGLLGVTSPGGKPQRNTRAS